MTKSLGTLTLDLVARIGGFVDGLSKAERESKKRMDGIKKSVAGVGAALGALGAGAAVGTAALVKSQIDLADAFSKQSSILGIAIEDLSALSYAADLSDVSNKQLETSITKLNKAMKDSLEGTGAGAEAFKVLGVNVKNADGTLRDSYSVFTDVADAFAGMEDGATKAALAQEIFGKSGTKLIPLLNGGAEGLADMRREAEQLGQVIDSETGLAAEAFNDNLTRLQKVVSGTGNQLAKELLPSLVEFTDLIKDEKTQESIGALVKGIADIAIGMTKLVTGTIGATKEIAEFFAIANNGVDVSNLKDVNKEIDQIADLLNNRLGTIASNPLLPTRLAFANREELISEMQRLMKARDAILAEDEAESSKPAAAGKPDNKKDRTKEIQKEIELLKAREEELKKQEAAAQAALDAQSKIDDAFQSQLEAYSKQIALTEDATEAQKVRFEIEMGGLKGVTEEQSKQLIQLAEMADANKVLADAVEEVTKEQEKRKADFSAVENDLKTEEEKVKESYERRRQIILDNTEETGQKRAELLARLEEQTNEDLIEINGSYWEKWLASAEDNLQNFDELSGEVINNFSSRFGDAFESIIFDQQTLSEATAELAEGMARSVVNALGQMAAQWLAYQAVQLVAGKATAASAGVAISSNAYAQSLMAGLAAFASTAAIPIVGPAAAPAAMSAALAVTTPMATAISSLALGGMAHEGIDSIPKTGTWLLEKGERVTTEKTSAKLDRTLEEIRAGQRGKMRNNVTNNFNINTPKSDSFRMSQRQIMRQAKRGLSG
jgi:hypothetical protein